VRRLVGPALLLVGLPLLFSCESSPAWAIQPTLRLTQGARASLRSKGDLPSELISRAELDLFPQEKWWRAFPFVEARWDVDDAQWSKVELGGEADVKPFAWCTDSCSSWYIRPLSWFSAGQAFYQRWFSPDISPSDPAHPPGKLRQLFPGNTHTEWNTRTRFDVPLPWRVRSRPLEAYALNEYIFDLNEGRGIRNEVGAGLKVPLPMTQRVDLLLGWRHVDLIHLLDVDQFEGSVQVEF